MKRTYIFCIAVCLLISISFSAYASEEEGVSVCSDLYINYAKAQFNSDGVVEFYVSIHGFADSIYVSGCRLQEKEGTTWVNKGNLAVPSDVLHNVCVYSASANYSDKLATGNTYRVIVTYNIDGYLKSYTSNTISY